MKPKVAFLGLGIMGRGMAQNLLTKGFPLTVWNRTLEKTVLLADGGAHVAATPADATQDADVVVSMVGDDTASRAVWLGEHGALSAMKRGAIAIESSTLTPDWVRELNAVAAERGISFLDAPVTGSKSAAENGTLRLFVGGSAQTLETARPVLETFSTNIHHMGDAGAGATWKLINNMTHAIQLAALGESLVLAEAAGIDMQQAQQLILEGASASPIVKMKLPRMMERRYDDTDFALKWMTKDMRYALELGDALHVDLQALRGALKDYEAALRQPGLGEEDFAAVYEGARQGDV